MDRKYELFEIIPDSLKLKHFRRAYIETMGSNIFYKIQSNRTNWFYYKKGIFDVSKILGTKFFEFTTFPDNFESDKKIVDDFVEYGINNVIFIKAVKILDKTYYFYIPNNNLDKVGRRYICSPVIPISEDVYNLSLISLNSFRNLSICDFSKYREFFSVSDKPSFVINKRILREGYETGKFSLEEYNNILELFDTEERCILSLR